MGLAGTAAILSGRAQTGGSEPNTLGYAAAFGCALVWSGYSVLNRRFSAVSSDMIVGVCGAVALAGLLAHCVFETKLMPTPQQWGAIVVLGVGPTGLAFLAWDHATKHGRLPLLGALSYLAPLISTLLLILDGEAQASFEVLVAAVLIIAGALTATGLPHRNNASA